VGGAVVMGPGVAGMGGLVQEAGNNVRPCELLDWGKGMS